MKKVVFIGLIAATFSTSALLHAEEYCPNLNLGEGFTLVQQGDGNVKVKGKNVTYAVVDYGATKKAVNASIKREAGNGIKALQDKETAELKKTKWPHKKAVIKMKYGPLIGACLDNLNRSLSRYMFLGHCLR